MKYSKPHPKKQTIHPPGLRPALARIIGESIIDGVTETETAERVRAVAADAMEQEIGYAALAELCELRRCHAMTIATVENPTASAAEQLSAFVGVNHEPSDIVEIRRLRGSESHPTWHAAQDVPAQAKKLASENADGFNIYIGVNPRNAKGAKGDNSITLARSIFADFDGVPMEDVAARLADANLPAPTMVVASGHGFHPYWGLSQTCADLSAWRELMKDLAALIGSDPKICNPERIMRAPGFLNVKREPFVPCRLLECELSRRVSFAGLRSIIPTRPAEKKPERKSAPSRTIGANAADGLKRCLAYLAKVEDAIQGQDGSGATLRAACECVRFGLSESELWEAMQWFNAHKCKPEWSEKELAHKIKSAQDKAAGEAGSRLKENRPGYRGRVNGNGKAGMDAPSQEPNEFSPSDPLPIARAFRAALHWHADGPTLHCDDSNIFYAWTHSHYVERKESAIRADLYPYLEKAKKWVKRGDDMQLVPFAPTTAIVNNVVDALQSLSFNPTRPPCWLCDAQGLPDPVEIIPARNGLVRLSREGAKLFRPPTPLFFSPNALDFIFDADAPEPAEWLRFLNQLWPDDPQSISLLRQWFGYCLTPDTRQQKALLLVGPKRAGKGTIARVLTRLIGPLNVCGPTLSGLSTNFGLWPLIGKLLAIISDARLSGRTDQAIIVERILAIVGEDAITIDRKNREPVTEKLRARFMVLTNELPRLADASGALASRFVVLTLAESFYGKEDTALEDRICRELPGILLWAIRGWQELQREGHFIQPKTSAAAIEELNDLASPISAFIRDWCAIRPGESIAVAELFEAWQVWCRQQGRDQAGTAAVFGRDLRAAVPRIAVKQKREMGDVHRCYEGIDLTVVARSTVSVEKSKTGHRVSRDVTRDTPL